MSREALATAAGDAVRRAIPLGRPGTPEEIAGPVAFLASDLAVLHARPGPLGQRRRRDGRLEPCASSSPGRAAFSAAASPSSSTAGAWRSLAAHRRSIPPPGPRPVLVELTDEDGPRPPPRRLAARRRRARGRPRPGRPLRGAAGRGGAGQRAPARHPGAAVPRAGPAPRRALDRSRLRRRPRLRPGGRPAGPAGRLRTHQARRRGGGPLGLPRRRPSCASPSSWAAVTGPGPPRRSRWRGPCAAGQAAAALHRRAPHARGPGVGGRRRRPPPRAAGRRALPPRRPRAHQPPRARPARRPRGSGLPEAGIVAGRQADHAGPTAAPPTSRSTPARARRELGWEPRPIDEAIRESRAASRTEASSRRASAAGRSGPAGRASARPRP